MNREHSKLKALVYVVTPLLVFFIDLLSKRIVEAKLAEGKSLQIVGHYIEFTFVHNYGTTFGLFSAGAPFLAISLVKVIFIFTLFACVLNVERFILGARHQLLSRICLLAMIGGSCGNLVDRLFDRRVTDFIDIGIQAFRWPVFNLGDAFQVVGGLTVLWIMVLQQLKAKDA